VGPATVREYAFRPKAVREYPLGPKAVREYAFRPKAVRDAVGRRRLCNRLRRLSGNPFPLSSFFLHDFPPHGPWPPSLP
jgi:hypothetical protein